MIVVAAAAPTGHGAHAALAFAVVAGLAAAATAADLVARRRPLRPGVLAAVLLSTVAAAVHFAVTPEHLEEARVIGAFFLTVGLGQLVWSGLALLRPSQLLLRLGILANAALILLWLLSRTVGVPLGPEAGAVEPVGAADLTATLAELWLVVALIRQLRAPALAQPAPPAAIRATPSRAAATPRS